MLETFKQEQIQIQIQEPMLETFKEEQIQIQIENAGSIQGRAGLGKDQPSPDSTPLHC